MSERERELATAEKTENETVAENIKTKFTQPEIDPEFEKFQKQLRKLDALLGVLQGRPEGLQSRYQLIMNPQILETASKISRRESAALKFLTYFIRRFPRVFEPDLGVFCEQWLKLKLSEKGWAIEKLIELEGAVEQGRLLRGMTLNVQRPTLLGLEEEAKKKGVWQRLKEKLTGGGKK